MQRRTFLQRLGLAGASTLPFSGCLGSNAHPQFTINAGTPPFDRSSVQWPSTDGWSNQRMLNGGSLPSLNEVSRTASPRISPDGLVEHAVAEDTVYTLYTRGLDAFSTDDGSVQWSLRDEDFDGLLFAQGLFIGSDTFYIAHNHRVTQHRLTDGKMISQFQLPDNLSIKGIDHLDAETLLLRAEAEYGDMVAVALDPTNGNRLWSFRTRISNPPQTPVGGAVSGDSYIMAANASDHTDGRIPNIGFIHSITPSEGTFDWTRRLHPRITGISAAGSTAVIQTAVDTRLLDTETGIVRATVGSFSDRSFALTEQSLFLSSDGALRRYNTDGTQDWEVDEDSIDEYTAVTTDGETLFTLADSFSFDSSSSNRLAAYDARTGERLATLSVASDVGPDATIAATENNLSAITKRDDLLGDLLLFEDG